MDHLTVPYVDTYMSSVAHNVSRLGIADRHAAASLCLGGPGKRNACHRMAILDKSGAVKLHTCRGAAVHVGNSQLTVSRVYDRLGSRCISTGGTAG